MGARRGLLYRLSALAVTKITKPGRHADGGNLFLVVSQTRAKRGAFIWMRQGRQREAGLGGLSSVNLAEARQRAANVGHYFRKAWIRSNSGRLPKRPPRTAEPSRNVLRIS
jgi:hypothetical protein